jgi:hypothetical protein
MEVPVLTVSPADTSLQSEDVEDVEVETKTEKKPVKKRKSWGQELPVPKTNLPPRYVVAPYIILASSSNSYLGNAPRQTMRKNSAVLSEFFVTVQPRRPRASVRD